MSWIILILILIFSGIYLKAQTNFDSDKLIKTDPELDSASLLRTKFKSTSIERSNSLRTENNEAGKDRVSLLRLKEKIEAIANEAHLTEDKGNAFYDLGNYYADLDSQYLAIVYFNKAGVEYKQLTDTIKALEYLLKVRRELIHVFGYSQAAKYAELAIALSESIGMVQHSAQAHHDLGVILLRIKSQDSRKHFRLAADHFKIVEDSLGYSLANARLGDICRRDGQLDSATYYYIIHQEINQRLGRTRGMSSAYYKLSLVASQRGEIEKARELIDKALSICLSSKEKTYLSIFLSESGKIYNELGKFEEAIRDCEKAKALAHDAKNKREEWSACNCLSQAYSKVLNYSSAIINICRFNELSEMIDASDASMLWVQKKTRERLSLDSLKFVQQRFADNVIYQKTIAKKRYGSEHSTGWYYSNLDIGLCHL